VSRPDPLAFDPAAVVDALDGSGVEFALVGGRASQARARRA